MSKKAKYEVENEVENEVAVEAMETVSVDDVSEALVEAFGNTGEASVPAERILVLGSKVPKHRAGHNHDAWQAISYQLPCSANFLATLPEVQACGGIKGNGMLFLGYAIRRGWLREIA
jgi:hypothetical protein